MKFFRRIVVCRLLCKDKKDEELVNGTARSKAIADAQSKRQEAEMRIKNMVAQINGCGDRWFLQPVKSIDECMDDNGNGG